MSRYAQPSRTAMGAGRWLAVGLLSALAVVLHAGPAPAQEMRKWRDNSGQFEVEAKLVSSAKGLVTLEQADGSTLEIELDKLSKDDRDYVARQAANPFRKKAAPTSPFLRKPGAPAAAPASRDDASHVGGAGRVVRPSWDGVETLTVTPSSTEWSVTVAAPRAAAEPAKLRPVPVPPKADFFERPKGVAVNAAGTRAVVGYATAPPGFNQKGTSRLVFCDLEAGKMLGSGSQAGIYRPLALSDDGTQALVRTDTFGPGGGTQLEFWSLGKSGVVKGDCWEPYAGTKGGDADVRWAGFLDAERFATASEAGKLVIWQARPLKPLATLPIHSGCTPAISPDRKLLAFATDKEIGLFDVAANGVLALQPAPQLNMAWAAFAFSPSGRRLACQVHVGKLFVYDVADGSRFREVSLHGLNAQNPAVFTDDDHVMIGQTLVDLSSQVRLWTYQGAEGVVTAGGLTYFEVAAKPKQAGGLIPARLPQKGVQAALETALRDPNFFIVKSGSEVAIDVGGIPDASQRSAVTAALAKNLAAIGVRVAASAPVVVQASVEPGKEEEIAYRQFGAGFSVDRFKVRPQISRIKFVYNGKTAWETSTSSVPSFEMVRLKKDESLQDHVKKFEQPNYAYFGRVELPRLLTKPTGSGGGSGTLGVSQVTIAGVR